MTNQVVTQTPTPQPNDSGGIVNYASGGFTTDGGTAVALTILTGFTPRKVKLVDLTTPKVHDYMDQMAANQTLETAANGTLTAPTTGLITLTDRGFVLAASILTATASFAWEAFA